MELLIINVEELPRIGVMDIEADGLLDTITRIHCI
jgi:hypothetical protein